MQREGFLSRENHEKATSVVWIEKRKGLVYHVSSKYNFLLFPHLTNVLGTYYVLCRHGQSSRDILD